MVTRTSISPALKTVRRTVFALRDADAGRGLFDSRMGHHLRCLLYTSFGGYTPDGKLVFSSRLFADTALSSDELLYKIVNMLAMYGAEPQQITAVIFSSVVPALTPRLREALRKMCECQIMEVGPGLKSGVRIRMDNPCLLYTSMSQGWYPNVRSRNAKALLS